VGINWLNALSSMEEKGCIGTAVNAQRRPINCWGQ